MLWDHFHNNHICLRIHKTTPSISIHRIWFNPDFSCYKHQICHSDCFNMFLTKSSTNSNWPSLQVGIFIPILYKLQYMDRHLKDHDIFNLSNSYHKTTNLASNNQIREHRSKTKTNHYTIKISITENKHIYLPTNFEAETLVLGS